MRKLKSTLKEFKTLSEKKPDLKAYRSKKWDKVFYYNKDNILTNCMLSTIEKNIVFIAVVKNTKNFDKTMLIDMKHLCDFYIEHNLIVCIDLQKQKDKVLKILKKRYNNIIEMEDNIVAIIKD